MLGEVFDPKAETHIFEHCRPHWSQAGAVVFVTFRTEDSIPQKVTELWDRQKTVWLERRGYDGSQHWQKNLPLVSEKDRADFLKEFNRCREDFLDTCHGECVLRRAELGNIVARSLLHFDEDRYRMGDFVVMPNHVHLLAVFRSPELLKTQCDSWLHFTAVQINQVLKRKGKFWQQEPFDHLVRSAEQYEYLRNYIVQNPAKACLQPREYYYRRFKG